MTIKEIREAHIRAIEKLEPPEPLPKRFDTKPLKFEVFRQRLCVWCDAEIPSGKFCCEEHKLFYQEYRRLHAEKLQREGHVNDRGQGVHQRERYKEPLRQQILQLPHRLVTARQAGEVWGTNPKVARNRLLSAQSWGWVSRKENLWLRSI